ncbi:hypothetical protein M752DRAFT_276951 [Aspergillus phoenicis ATCC 13157]|uniref:Uncharacterized protein n=1 Tax=Aspergillus phoenicis ATCC 13157 TaxID=1353007 RepID=A0A370PH89_ASPPH|nr:hypothetical protein CBS147346_9654 [Aspergillus niger]RDK41512.1 hypothetical protein M752DRAFT_276951 [Aspergillus phoenicis ATCC 13157]
MKTTLALSALISSMLAAAAPTSSSFQLVISSNTDNLNGRALISQGDAFIVAPSGEHGINFTGGDGTLGIENGDVVYVGTDGHVDLKSTDSVQSGGLTQGFTTGSDNTLEWAQGNFYACPHQSLYAAGEPTYMIYTSRSGVTLSSTCVQVALREVSA